MIYRVTVKNTMSLQSQDTFWDKATIFCGTNREDARVKYLESENIDYSLGLGNNARKTVLEKFESTCDDIASTECLE